MRKKLLLTAMSATLSLGILGACGADNNRMGGNNDDVDYTPVRYDRQNDNGVFDTDRGNRGGDRNNNLDPFQGDNNDGIFNTDTNNGYNLNRNTDLFDNTTNGTGTTNTNRGTNGVDPGTNGTMRGR